MEIIEGFGIGVLILLLALAALFTRRELIGRGGGTIELYFRLNALIPGRGWSPGIARFVDDELRWYRVFSFGGRPTRVLSRRGLAIAERRAPQGPEQLTLPGNWVVLRCVTSRDVALRPVGVAGVEIAMAQSALTGFLYWIEAAPPGGPPNSLLTY